ncbi:MAG: hypothetical protein ACJ8G4_21420 [Burkholderiales bacterium]
MWAGIALKIAQWFAGKGFETLADAYKAKLAAGNDRERTAADLAARELAVAQREIELQAQLRIAEMGRWYEPTHLFGYVMVAYFGKVILWDKVLGALTHGSTDAITGDVATWASWIMLFYVGKRGFENVARILKR